MAGDLKIGSLTGFVDEFESARSIILSEPNIARVVAVVVTYFPEKKALASQIIQLRKQVSHVVLVDNTPIERPNQAEENIDFITPIRLGENVGLAKGINVGVLSAREMGATHVLLMDQDSIPQDGMVEKLIAGLTQAQKTYPVAAAGPTFLDSRGATFTPFWRVGFPRNKPASQSKDEGFIFTDCLITSGCLISLEAFQQIGEMNEHLFIDNVDLEWCLRARYMGWRLVGIPDAILSHQLGDTHILAPWYLRILGKKVVIQHNSTRLYYIIRNRILLYRMKQVPLLWKLQDAIRIPGKFVIGISIGGSKWDAMKAMLHGCWHGLINVAGEKPQPVRSGGK